MLDHPEEYSASGTQCQPVFRFRVRGDEDGRFKAVDPHCSRFCSSDGMNEFGQGDENVDLRFILAPAFKDGKHGGFRECGPRDFLCGVVSPDKNVRAGTSSRMQPEIVGRRQLEHLCVAFGIPSAQKEKTVRTAKGLYVFG